MGGRVEGKVALITGAARGQGRSHAVRLAEEGADIIALDLLEEIDTVPYPLSRPADLERTVQLVQRTGRRIVAAQADVRELMSFQVAVDEAVAELGGVDIVIANAGIHTLGRSTVQAFLDVIQVNLIGAINTVVAVEPHLRPCASIVLTGSAGDPLDNRPHATGTAGFDHASSQLASFADELARSFAERQIRVNVVHPTVTRTGMTDNAFMHQAALKDVEAPPGRGDSPPARFLADGCAVDVTRRGVVDGPLLGVRRVTAGHWSTDSDRRRAPAEHFDRHRSPSPAVRLHVPSRSRSRRSRAAPSQPIARPRLG